ncbi:hypothetical protein VCG_000855 [Vibrio cholerae 12129(1)]|nr:hypothetical protein VCG_000855 [Vibrio cholerae 12129(1)]
MDNTKTYSKTSIALHWIVGLAFIGVFIVGAYLSDLPRGPEKMELVALHKSFGVLILLLALARVFWRIKEGAIPPGLCDASLARKSRESGSWFIVARHTGDATFWDRDEYRRRACTGSVWLYAGCGR